MSDIKDLTLEELNRRVDETIERQGFADDARGLLMHPVHAEALKLSTVGHAEIVASEEKAAACDKLTVQKNWGERLLEEIEALSIPLWRAVEVLNERKHLFSERTNGKWWPTIDSEFIAIRMTAGGCEYRTSFEAIAIAEKYLREPANKQAVPDPEC